MYNGNYSTSNAFFFKLWADIEVFCIKIKSQAKKEQLNC